MSETVKETVEQAGENKGLRVESGIVLKMNEQNIPEAILVGSVSLLEITAYKRLMEITEENVWEQFQSETAKMREEAKAKAASEEKEKEVTES